MAFRRRRRTGGLRWSRRTKRGAWTGLGVQAYTVGSNQTNSYYLWDDLHSQKYGVDGKCTHQRTVVWMSFIPTVYTSNVSIAWYISPYPTDQLGNIPTSLIISPLGYDGVSAYNQHEALLERNVMSYEYKRIVGAYSASTLSTFEAGLNWQTDCKSKRKLDDTDCLMLSFASTHPGSLSFVSRTYMSW